MYGHIEGVFELVSDVDRAVLVADAPGLRLAAVALEGDGGQREALAFHPDEVLIVGVLIDGLVAGEVEGEEFLFAVYLAPAHGGQPVIVRAEGIVALVVVDDADRVLVGHELLAVHRDVTRGFQEIFLGVERLVGTEGDGHIGRGRQPLHLYVDLESSELSVFRPTAGVRLSVHEVVLDDILALFDLERAMIVHELRGDLRLLHGHDVAPGRDLARALVEPYEDGKAEGTRVVDRGDQRTFFEMHLERLPLGEAALLHAVGHVLAAGFLAVEQIETLEGNVEGAEVCLPVLDDAVGGGDGAPFFGDIIGIFAHFFRLPDGFFAQSVARQNRLCNSARRFSGDNEHSRKIVENPPPAALPHSRFPEWRKIA